MSSGALVFQANKKPKYDVYDIYNRSTSATELLQLKLYVLFTENISL